VSEGERGRQAELRAQRIRWRGRSRSMNEASRDMDERLRKMDDQAGEQPRQAAKSSSGGNQGLARPLGRPAEAWVA
jgi:hypothetical protein